MKKVIPFLVLILALQFTACSKDNEEPVNNAPVIENQEFSVNVNSILTLQVTASDVDNDTLTFSIKKDDYNLFKISEDGIIRTINGNAITTLRSGDPYTIEIEVTDGKATATATIEIKVIVVAIEEE